MLLGAGLGTRLRPITYELPKPMMPVLDRPIMSHILKLLARHGFKEVIANLYHLPDMIRDHFGDGSDYAVSLSYSPEDKLLGTAGGVRKVRDFLGEDTFLVISGDALTDIDLGALWKRHQEAGGIGTLSLKRVADPSQLGVVVLGPDGHVQGFQEKPDPAEALSNLANCGIYVFEPEIFDYFPDRDVVDWATDVFPALLDGDVALYGHEISEYWNDIGSIGEFRQGNFDALAGKVEIEFDATQVEDGVWRADSAVVDQEVALEPPAYLGRGCHVGARSRLSGPVIVGAGSRVGEGSSVGDAVLLPGAEVPRSTVIVGGIAGAKPNGRRSSGAPR
jgi:mannose-1-phosphate guanylyltransferase